MAVLDSGNRVRYVHVQLGRDYGAQIEVSAGLKAGQTVIIPPGASTTRATMPMETWKQPLESAAFATLQRDGQVLQVIVKAHAQRAGDRFAGQRGPAAFEVRQDAGDQRH